MTHDQEVDTSTLIEFRQTLVDMKNGFTLTLSVKIGEEGIMIGHEFGSNDGMCNASSQGQITIDTLKGLLHSCHQDEIEIVGVKIMTQSYDPQTREMSDSIDTLEVSFQEPLNFRPFFLQFLPIAIKAAELLDDEILPYTVTTTNPGMC